MSTSSKSRDPEGKVTVGYISSAHGLKGEVRIVPLTDHPERFRGMDVLNLHSSDGRFVRTFHIRNLREHEGKGEFIAAGDPVDRNEAEKLVGLSILVDREERFPLPEGEFWVDDLIGLQVQDTEGNPLGEVVDFLSAGGNEIYAVRDEKGSLHYIPAVEEFVKDIDLASETMVVKLIEGLW